MRSQPADTHEGSEEQKDGEVEGRDDEHSSLWLRSDLRVHCEPVDRERDALRLCPLGDIVVGYLHFCVRGTEVQSVCNIGQPAQTVYRRTESTVQSLGLAGQGRFEGLP